MPEIASPIGGAGASPTPERPRCAPSERVRRWLKQSLPMPEVRATATVIRKADKDAAAAAQRETAQPPVSIP